MPLDPKDIIAFNRSICEDIKIELLAQGHNLTGQTINSIYAQMTFEDGTIILEGYGSVVVAIQDKGVEPNRTSWRQFPFLIQYFRQRGYNEKQAKAFAAATIRTWAKQGMSTLASKRFSETGQRQGAVETVFEENADRYDQALGDAVDLSLQEIFDQQVSEEI